MHNTINYGFEHIWTNREENYKTIEENWNLYMGDHNYKALETLKRMGIQGNNTFGKGNKTFGNLSQKVKEV